MDTTKKGTVANLEEKRRNITSLLDEDSGDGADDFPDIGDKQSNGNN